MGRRLNSVHPGEVLAKEFLKPLEVSAYRLAKAKELKAIVPLDQAG